MTSSPPATPASPRPRPLSPHLQVYRLPLSALTSIAHRLTGVALSAGAFVLALWLYAAAADAALFGALKALFATLPGKAALAGWAFALFYHLCAGVRHLIWDTGAGFEKAQFRFTNWVVIAAALVLTACALARACAQAGPMTGGL